MNKKFFIFVLSAAAVIFLSVFSFIKPNYPGKNEAITVTETSTEKAALIIDYGDGNPLNYDVEITGEETAFGLLKNITEKEEIELKFKEYDFGIFVESVGGKESTAEMAWIYFVNGESGQIAADKQIVNPKDTIEWKYIKPSMGE